MYHEWERQINAGVYTVLTVTTRSKQNLLSTSVNSRNCQNEQLTTLMPGHLLKKAKLESATRKGPNIGPTVCQSRGNSSNEIP